VGDKVSLLTRLTVSGKLRIFASECLGMSPRTMSGKHNHHVSLIMKMYSSFHVLDTSGNVLYLDGI